MMKNLFGNNSNLTVKESFKMKLGTKMEEVLNLETEAIKLVIDQMKHTIASKKQNISEVKNEIAMRENAIMMTNKFLNQGCGEDHKHTLLSLKEKGQEQLEDLKKYLSSLEPVLKDWEGHLKEAELKLLEHQETVTTFFEEKALVQDAAALGVKAEDLYHSGKKFSYLFYPTFVGVREETIGHVEQYISHLKKSIDKLSPKN